MAAAAASACVQHQGPASPSAAPAHHRQSSATHKRRPALGRRSTAETKAQSKAKRRSGDFSRAPSSAVEDSDMSSGFAQFCATCETQIVVPSTSILYCSERCRRKDCGMSPPHSPAKRPYASPVQAADADVDIIPPLSPTARPHPSYYAGASATPSSESQAERSSYYRRDSEVASYLSQPHSVERPRSLRPRSSRQSTVPSLSHSPSSTASGSVPYPMVRDVARPLPSRTLVSKSVDLVTPAAAGSGSGRVPDSLETLTARAASLAISGAGRGRAYMDEEDVYDDIGYDDAPASYYEKRTYGDVGSATAQSSLKQLLSSERRKS